MTLKEKYNYLTKLLASAPDTFKFRLVQDITLTNKNQLIIRLGLIRIGHTVEAGEIYFGSSRNEFEWMNDLYKELKQLT